MIQILLLDLGDTLIRDNVLLPNVVEALTALGGFKTAAGEPLAMALVSDYKMPAPPPTDAKVKALFVEYLKLLDTFGLRSFFEPASQHVTLSTHAGVFKPDKRIFETALKRLAKPIDLARCLFITENAGHIAAAKALGMQALRFDADGAQGADFDDWSVAPLLVARLVTPNDTQNLQRALKTYLAIREDLDLMSLERAPDGTTVHVQVRSAYPLSAPNLGELDGVRVSLPLHGTLQLGDNGLVRSLEWQQPSDEELAEAAHFVQTLVANKSVSTTPDEILPDATHQVEIGADGTKTLKRKRFSAL